MKKIILLFTLLCVSWIGLTQKISNNSSPESQALIKNVNLSVNKSTGIASVNIPIYTINNGSIEVPIGLNYNCTGIKIKDQATWVGTGWTLSAGGKITRIIMDEDDKGGYVGSDGTSTNDLNSWSIASNFDNRCDEKFDSEPDLFYFEIPGRSGMFVFDHTGVAYTIPYSNLKITHTNFSDFKIRDENGVVYSFGNEETTVERVNDDAPKTYVSTWNLIKIRNLKGDEISFNYFLGGELRSSSSDAMQYNNEEPIYKHTHVKTTPYYLSSIVWNNGKLVFSSSTQRIDLENGRRLNRISVYTFEDKFLKHIDFSYSNFFHGRLKLDRVFENDGQRSLLISNFGYNEDVNLPNSSYAFDHWGYFNRSGNSTLVKANREVNFDGVKANILISVSNNMWARTTYEYEPHQLPGTNRLLAGIRVKGIKKYNEANQLYEHVQYTYENMSHFEADFIYDNAVPGGRVYYAYSTINLNDIGGSNVYYGKVTETHINGSKIESYYNTYDNFSIGTDIIQGAPDILSDYYLAGGSSIPNTDWSLFLNTSQFWKRGLLQRQLSYASGNITPTREEIYTYELDNTARKEINSIIPSRFNTTMAQNLGRYIHLKWISQPLIIKSTFTTGDDILTTKVENTYDMTNLVLTEQLTTINNTDKFKTKIKYPCHYGTSNYEINLLVQNGVMDIPIEKISYKNNALATGGYEIVGGELLLFKSVLNDQNVDMPVLHQKKILLLNSPLLSGFSESAVSGGQLSYDSRYFTSMTYDYYDTKLNPISSHSENSQNNSVIYGYNFSLPIGLVTNAVATKPGNTEGKNQVFHTSFEDVTGATSSETAKTGNKVWSTSYTMNFGSIKPGSYVLSYWRQSGTGWILVEQGLSLTSSMTSYTINSSSYPIDEVRLIPRNAMMTTCTYIPGVGKTSETDTNGVTTYYEYDVFGRLSRVLDNDRNKVKEYEYFIKPF